jgi:hypothetical protein
MRPLAAAMLARSCVLLSGLDRFLNCNILWILLSFAIASVSCFTRDLPSTQEISLFDKDNKLKDPPKNFPIHPVIHSAQIALM